MYARDKFYGHHILRSIHAACFCDYPLVTHMNQKISDEDLE